MSPSLLLCWCSKNTRLVSRAVLLVKIFFEARKFQTKSSVQSRSQSVLEMLCYVTCFSASLLFYLSRHSLTLLWSTCYSSNSNMLCISFVASFVSLIPFASPLRYDPAQVSWNLNQNQSATDPLAYYGQWPNHSKSQQRSIKHEDID